MSMGNPHAIVFVPDVDALDLPTIGPQFETHPSFPAKINTEFVQVRTEDCVLSVLLPGIVGWRSGEPVCSAGHTKTDIVVVIRNEIITPWQFSIVRMLLVICFQHLFVRCLTSGNVAELVLSQIKSQEIDVVLYCSSISIFATCAYCLFFLVRAKYIP